MPQQHAHMATFPGWVALSPNIRSSTQWRALLCVNFRCQHIICLKLSFANMRNTSFLIVQKFEFSNFEFNTKQELVEFILIGKSFLKE